MAGLSILLQAVELANDVRVQLDDIYPHEGGEGTTRPLTARVSTT